MCRASDGAAGRAAVRHIASLGAYESKVGFVRRNAFVPVPTVGDLAEYNESLMGVADSWATRAHYRRGTTWGELFEADRAALVALPARPFSATRWLTLATDKWGEVALAGGHRYLASADLPLSDVHVGLGAYSVTFVDPSTGEACATYDREFGTAPTTSSDPVVPHPSVEPASTSSTSRFR